MARKVSMVKLVAATFAAAAAMTSGCACNKPHRETVDERSVMRAAERQEIDAGVMAGYAAVLHELTVSVERASDQVRLFEEGTVSGTDARVAVLTARGRVNVVRAYLRALMGSVPREELVELSSPVDVAEDVLAHAQAKYEARNNRDSSPMVRRGFADAIQLDNGHFNLVFHQRMMDVDVAEEPAFAQVLRFEHGSATGNETNAAIDAFEAKVHVLELWFAGVQSRLSASDQRKIESVIAEKRAEILGFRGRVGRAWRAAERLRK